MTGHQTLKAYR